MAGGHFAGGPVSSRQADRGFTVLIPLSQSVTDGEHVALLADPGRFRRLRRSDDLFDDGVAALFGLTGGEAELVGFAFDAGTFSPAEATHWLRERGFPARLDGVASSWDRRQ
jgi:hypothetical protein